MPHPLEFRFQSKYVVVDWIGLVSSFNSCFTFGPIFRRRPGLLQTAEANKTSWCTLKLIAPLFQFLENSLRILVIAITPRIGALTETLKYLISVTICGN